MAIKSAKMYSVKKTGDDDKKRVKYMGAGGKTFNSPEAAKASKDKVISDKAASIKGNTIRADKRQTKERNKFSGKGNDDTSIDKVLGKKKIYGK